MKTRFFYLAVVFVLTLVFHSCELNEVPEKPDSNSILPERFKVDIPSSLTSTNTAKKSLIKSAKIDTLNGNGIYMNLNTFIAVGAVAGNMVEEIIGAIVIYRINKPMVLTFQSNDDKRPKTIVVEENGEYGGVTYQYVLTMTDDGSISAADKGKGMQIFWNTNPIEGVAILKPYNIDRTKNSTSPDAIFSIEYSEVATPEYDSHMIVTIDGLPLNNPNNDRFSINTLKMFVGKKGDNVDIYGNSNHPNAKFFTEETGFNWAFVASGSKSADIAVAEVGLPPSTLDNSTRSVILGDYSIKNVFTDQINTWFYNSFGFHPAADDLAAYLANTNAPGFFNRSGFIKAGTAPTAQYEPLIGRISNMTPYNPKYINDLTVDFK